MTDIEIGKAKLEKILLEVCDDYLNNIELAPKEDVHYSPALEKKMQRFIKCQNSRWHKYVNTSFKRCIAACLITAILLATLISCTPIREPIVEFFKNVYEHFTEFCIADKTDLNAPDFIEEVHTLSYIPDGYELVEAPTMTGNDFKIRTVWQDSNGNKIILLQMILNMRFTLNTEHNSYKDYINNNIDYSLVQKDKEFYAFWNTKEYSFVLLTESLSEDEIFKIAKFFY